LESLRELVATVCFVAGTVAIALSFDTPFLWSHCITGIILYVVCYFVWPSKRKGERQSDNSFLDFLELIFEFPVELIIWPFRLLWRLLRAIFSGKGDTGGIDF